MIVERKPKGDAFVWGYRSVITAFAGLAAERRLRHGSGDGWKPFPTSEDKRRAFHEAGHVVAAHLSGDHVYFATILPDPTVRVGRNGESVAGGHVSHGRHPKPAKKADDWVSNNDSDLRWCAKLCSLMAPDCNWKTILKTARTLRQHSRDLVDDQWPLVRMFAYELLEKQQLNQDRIEAIFSRLEPTLPLDLDRVAACTSLAALPQERDQ